jgi:hypothetical protein
VKKRRKIVMNKLRWSVKGIFNEACAAEGHCPFYFGRDKSGGCQYFMVLGIQEGKVNDVDLSGITVIYCGLITYSKYEDFLNNGEEVGIYINNIAIPEQREVLEPFTKQGMGTILIQKAYGIKYVKMNIEIEENSFYIKMPFGEMKQILTKGLDGSPVRIENQLTPTLANVKACHSPFWRYSDYGRSFEYTNRCATWADFRSEGEE